MQDPLKRLRERAVFINFVGSINIFLIRSLFNLLSWKNGSLHTGYFGIKRTAQKVKYECCTAIQEAGQEEFRR